MHENREAKNSKQPPKNHSLGFSTPEHQSAGNSIALKMLDKEGKETNLSLKDVNMLKHEKGQITERKNFKLGYGDILALAGDYYAIANKPIAQVRDSAQKQERFKAAFNTLANSNKKVTEKIFQINGTTYSKNATLNEYIQQFRFVRLLGRNYFKITNNNLDHFRPWSFEAYKAGHEVAIQMAQEGYKRYEQFKSNPKAPSAQELFEESQQYLQLAYQMNAFACHFLSDSFSAGHLRESQLRVELSKQFGILGSILVNNMHNEDSKNGINVKNKNGSEWVAYGDDHLDISEDSQNRDIHHEALQLSANEIFDVYNTGLAKESKVGNFIPEVDDQPNEKHPQPKPMFKLKGKKIYYRDPIHDLNPQNEKYTKLSFFKALTLVIKLRFFPPKMDYVPTQNKSVAGYNPYHNITSTSTENTPRAKNTLQQTQTSERTTGAKAGPDSTVKPLPIPDTNNIYTPDSIPPSLG